MSADEDTELRDLVAHTLETNGVLGKIRAQLRASVFLALEEQESVQNKTPFLNQELKRYLATKEGRSVAGLVKEFLQFFNLDFTLSVFDSESGLGDHYEGRSHLARELDIIESGESAKYPLLAEVTKRSTGTSQTGPRNTVPEDLTEAHLKEAREKFNYYDKDHNGVIDKDELRELFSDIFPGFHRNMLDRYVNDEFAASDKDFSQTIDFNEFLDMYKRLFVLCKSVVSSNVSDLRVSTPQSPGRSRPSPLKKSQGGVVNSFVDSINKKNEDSSKFGQSEKPSRAAAVASPRDISTASDADNDSFFDDPVPSDRGLSFGSSLSSPRSSPRSPKTPPPTLPKPNISRIPRASKSPPPSTLAKPSSTTSNSNNPLGGGGGGGGLSSLSGLPALNNNGPTPSDTGRKTPPTPDMEKDIKDIDKKMTDLGFDVPEDSYDEDFESSKSTDGSDKDDPTEGLDDIDNSKPQYYEPEKAEEQPPAPTMNGESLSPFGQTPRSARSDNNVKSIEEDIEEDIDDDDDLSGAEDLLKSDPSAMDDLTTDRTVSPTEQSAAFDYVEDILP